MLDSIPKVTRALLIEFFFCVECIVRMTSFNQLVGVLCINALIFSDALFVRGARAFSKPNTFVGLNSAPLQCSNNVFFCARNKTVLVGILNTKYEIAAVFFSEEIIIKRSANSAHM